MQRHKSSVPEIQQVAAEHVLVKWPKEMGEKKTLEARNLFISLVFSIPIEKKKDFTSTGFLLPPHPPL